jgi:hypothetical protein
MTALHTPTYAPTLRGDAMLLTHGAEGTERLVGAALLLDAVLGGLLDVEGPYVVGGPERAEGPLTAELRARVLAGPPESPRAWIERCALMAPTRVAAELVAAGVAAPLERRFQRRFTLSVDARAEAAARTRAAQDPVLGMLVGGWTLPPATHTLPPAVQVVLAQAIRSSAIASKTWTYASTDSSSWVTESVHSSSRPGVMKMPRFML